MIINSKEYHVRYSQNYQNTTLKTFLISFFLIGMTFLFIYNHFLNIYFGVMSFILFTYIVFTIYQYVKLEKKYLQITSRVVIKEFIYKDSGNILSGIPFRLYTVIFSCNYETDNQKYTIDTQNIDIFEKAYGILDFEKNEEKNIFEKDMKVLENLEKKASLYEGEKLIFINPNDKKQVYVENKLCVICIVILLMVSIVSTYLSTLEYKI